MNIKQISERLNFLNTIMFDKNNFLIKKEEFRIIFQSLDNPNQKLVFSNEIITRTNSLLDISDNYIINTIIPYYAASNIRILNRILLDINNEEKIKIFNTFISDIQTLLLTPKSIARRTKMYKNSSFQLFTFKKEDIIEISYNIGAHRVRIIELYNGYQYDIDVCVNEVLQEINFHIPKEYFNDIFFLYKEIFPEHDSHSPLNYYDLLLNYLYSIDIQKFNTLAKKII